jgi:hypothetical protein
VGSVSSGEEPVVGCSECYDELLDSGATQLVII